MKMRDKSSAGSVQKNRILVFRNAIIRTLNSLFLPLMHQMPFPQEEHDIH